MADANKPVRLSKAAREFNLGIGTIVDFLDTKGIQVEAKPNTKLDPEVYALVRSISKATKMPRRQLNDQQLMLTEKTSA